MIEVTKSVALEALRQGYPVVVEIYNLYGSPYHTATYSSLNETYEPAFNHWRDKKFYIKGDTYE